MGNKVFIDSNECCKTREIFRSKGAANVQLKILFEAQILWGFISKPCNYPDALYKRRTHQLVKWVAFISEAKYNVNSTNPKWSSSALNAARFHQKKRDLFG